MRWVRQLSQASHRDQSQNPLTGCALSPIRLVARGACRLSSSTDRRKSSLPRTRALLPCSLPSWPCGGSAEIVGAAVIMSRSVVWMLNIGRRDWRPRLNLLPYRHILFDLRCPVPFSGSRTATKILAGYSTRVPYLGTLNVCQSKAPARSRNSACATDMAMGRKATQPSSLDARHMMVRSDSESHGPTKSAGCCS